MTDRAAAYRLLSWLSPNFPVGAFSYSHGVENAVDTGRVTTPASLVDWIDTVLLLGAGRTDGLFFREAYRATAGRDAERLEEIAALATAFQPTAEFALESRAQGAAFLKAVTSAWPAASFPALPTPIAYPVAVAAACAAHDVPLSEGLHAYFHGLAANLVSAGLRLVPLGQTDGQLALAKLEASVAAATDQALAIPFDDLGSSAPVIEFASLSHETQYTRLFRS
jgi:urease accessory protein